MDTVDLLADVDVGGSIWFDENEIRDENCTEDRSDDIIARLKARALYHFDIDFMLPTIKDGSVAIAVIEDKDGICIRTMNLRLICPYELIICSPPNTKKHASKIIHYFIGETIKGRDVLQRRQWIRPPTDINFEYRLIETAFTRWTKYDDIIGPFIGLNIEVRRIRT